MRIVALATEDFRLYHMLVGAFKENEIPFSTFSPGDYIPGEVCAVFTSSSEKDLIKHPLVFAGGDNPRISIYQALHSLSGKDGYKQMVIGIDPGPRPGVAVVGDGIVLTKAQLERHEDMTLLVEDVLSVFPSEDVLVRTGHGDGVLRNRILNNLRSAGLSRDIVVEIVDETGTSSSHRRGSVHTDAAVAIAFCRGRKISDKELSVEPSLGEVRDIQRRSRDASSGRFTIDRESARLVAQGEKTLEEAVEERLKGETSGDGVERTGGG